MNKRAIAGAFAAIAAVMPGAARADEAVDEAHGMGAAPYFHLHGEDLSLIWGIPFAGILISIAVLPLVAPRFWQRHFGKVSAFWTACVLIPMVFSIGWETTLFELVHLLTMEYLPFIILLLTLFTVAGGIHIAGSFRGTPASNTAFLAAGTLIASWAGTTGASMLLIRPVIRANAGRRHNVHVIVFFIFLVSNIGGGLTPLGDPPLFLGFLKGVNFFWPTVHVFFPMLMMALPLLVIFYGLDSWYFRRESPPPPNPREKGARIGIQGVPNILLLGCVIGAVLMSGVWRSGIAISVFHVTLALENLLRDGLLLLIAWISWRFTSRTHRHANAFNWHPIIEVAKLFAGIFVTVIPVIAILRAGQAGEFSAILEGVSNRGEPINAMYFWVTGLLSSFLDNAPTYLVFFNAAGGDARELMGPLSNTLLAISAGAVFMGANSYIGNAPNFMVKAIAESRGIAMPSFFGYLAWSAIFLLPLFAVVTLVFFV
jgi:Na+/H+ antiporter NhaD/arsenite permease-like protein